MISLWIKIAGFLRAETVHKQSLKNNVIKSRWALI